MRIYGSFYGSSFGSPEWYIKVLKIDVFHARDLADNNETKGWMDDADYDDPQSLLSWPPLLLVCGSFGYIRCYLLHLPYYSYLCCPTGFWDLRKLIHCWRFRRSGGVVWGGWNLQFQKPRQFPLSVINSCLSQWNYLCLYRCNIKVSSFCGTVLNALLESHLSNPSSPFLCVLSKLSRLTMLSWGAAIKSFTIFGLNSLEWAGLGITTFIIFYFGLELLNVIYNTWLGQLLGTYVDLKKMGKWAGKGWISLLKSSKISTQINPAFDS